MPFEFQIRHSHYFLPRRMDASITLPSLYIPARSQVFLQFILWCMDFDRSFSWARFPVFHVLLSSLRPFSSSSWLLLLLLADLFVLPKSNDYSASDELCLFYLIIRPLPKP